MSNTNEGGWDSLESSRAITFTGAALCFLADLAILLVNFAAGTQDQYLALGQAFIGAGWVTAFIGLLGFYPDLAEQSRWLPRIGGVFAVVGLLTNIVMAVVSFGLFSGVLGGKLGDYTPYFLPGVFLGIVFGFGLYGVASLRTTTYRRGVGLLFLTLVVTFLFNLGTGVAGFNPVEKILVVVLALTLVTFTLGFLLQTNGAGASPEGTTAPESTP